ncbi:PREDICTED: uncharacterized protein LOC109477738 [Branchiostoma belcheri]|uniref:Uncharacterized protein LOC109477738 n=1 Tax=Branchiostoma belcheri TaxID=7741 RepID=A0A6P4ZUL7_BRABE|nr:PREDICTED: uncharacterized protein LOC109477738 [Branchiostoma belcheri]
MALFVLLKLLAFLSAMTNVSCDTGTCPNCQAVYANCCPDSSQPALLGAPCAICDAALNSEYTDAIPSCKLVQTTRSLWLRNYSLDHLSSTDVSHLKHLRFLHIEPGDIQHLDNNTFDGFTNLYNLSLSHNKLTYLGKQWLPEVSGHLNLAHNEIAFIEDGAFGAYDHCIETKALNLPWNRLDVIRPGYFRHLCNVMLLDLRRNRIQTIDKGSFNDLHRLRVLHLSGNKLKVVRRSWFPALERERLLGSLDLAKNQIQFIESEAFIHLQLLETLDLSDNQITSLQENHLQIGEWDWNIWDNIELKLEGNYLRCTCSLRWFIKLYQNLNNEFYDSELLKCSYPKGLRGVHLSGFSNAVIASLQCPTPKGIIRTIGDRRTFRCEMYWEERPPKIQWMLPNDTSLLITNVSFEQERSVYLGDLNFTTSFYMNPEGFTCCNSTPFNHSKLQNNTYNFVGKTISSLTVSPIVLQAWNDELVSCSSLFGSGETNITAHFNVTVFPPSLNAGPTISSTTHSKTETRRTNNNQLIHILDSEVNGNVAINYWDLVITTLLTSSVVALSCFLILALRKGKFKLWRVNPDNRDVQDQQNPDPFSQHTYETVRDEDQYEVIPDSQVEADDVITPYGQSTIAGAYRMDTPMAATANTSHVPKHRRVDASYVKRKRSQGQVPRDDKAADVAESSYKLEASRRGNVGVGTRGVQEGTCKAHSKAAQVNNGRGDRDLTKANDLKQTYDTATDNAGHFRESERTTWL